MPHYPYQNNKNPYTIKSVSAKLNTCAKIVKSADFTTNTRNVLGMCTPQSKKENFENANSEKCRLYTVNQ